MTKPITINVFSYPENSNRCEKTIGHIRELVKILKEEYKIDLDVEIKEGHKVNSSFSKFTIDFFDSCKKNQKGIDIYWLQDLNWITKEPNSENLSIIKSSLKQDYDYMKAFLLKAQKNSFVWKSATGAQFFTLENIKLKDGQGPCGVNIGDYPFCTAAETTGKKESIYHEFLHQIGVSEGYNKETKETEKYCSTNCWMQRNATNGKELCKYHQEELKRFLQKHNNKTKKR